MVNRINKVHTSLQRIGIAFWSCIRSAVSTAAAGPCANCLYSRCIRLEGTYHATQTPTGHVDREAHRNPAYRHGRRSSRGHGRGRSHRSGRIVPTNAGIDGLGWLCLFNADNQI